MLRNYLKIALRNLFKNKVYSFINIFGLSIGIACSMLMLIFVYNQLSYDRFNKKADQIYRLGKEVKSAEGENREPLSNAKSAIILKQNFPEVLNAVRFKDFSKVIVRYNDKQFYEKNVYYTDSDVFDVFTFPLTEGNPKTALVKPYSIVITEAMAEKYFGNENPMGKVLTFNKENGFIVTGVMKNLPKTTHREINILVSFATLKLNNEPDLNDWSSFKYFTYVLLKKDADYKSLETKFTKQMNSIIGKNEETINQTLSFYLLPLNKLYLYSNLDGNPPGLISEIIYYSLLAIFLTLIACVNFVNLSTAKASIRAKEIGLRKVIGAGKKQIVVQFLFEALVISIFALLVAFLIVQLLLPAFSDKVGVDLTLTSNQSIILYLGYFIVALFIGFISGIYPAFYLAKFQPAKVMKVNSLSGRKTWIRNALVVFQFFIAAVFISHTYVLNYQLKNLKSIDIGFNKKNVFVLPVPDDNVRQNINAFKTALLDNSNIIGITSTSSLPGLGIPRGLKIPEGFSNTEMQQMDEVNVDADFIPTLGIKIAEGRNFYTDNKFDEQNSVLVNQLAVQRFGWVDPIGKTIKYKTGDDEYAVGKVIGVVKDFHLSSLHRVIEPLFISNNAEKINYILIRYNPNYSTSALEYVEKQWKRIYPDYPFTYNFLDWKYDSYFRTLENVMDVLTFFAFLAITLACLGIFALAAFMSERRIKEIGIRKVLGGTTIGIIFKLNMDLLKYVFIAVLIIIPYAYFTKDMLNMFLPYMAGINYFVYVKALSLVFLLALLSVSYLAYKAANANPVESLRYE